MKGDIIVMVAHCITWTLVLLILEGGLLKQLKKIQLCRNRIKPKTDLKLDEDVIEEENRINQYTKEQ